MIDPLLDRLDEARARLRRTRLATGVLLVLATAVAAAFAWFLCDYLFVHRILEGGFLDATLRALLLVGAFAVIGRIAWRTVLAEWRTERDDDHIAGRVERTHRALGGRLISSVQLARVGEGSAMAPDLIEALIESTVAEAEAFDFRAIVDFGELKRAALWLLVPAVVVGGLTVWKPGYAAAAAKRMLLLPVEYPTATRILAVTPSQQGLVVPQGESLAFQVELDPEGYLPDVAEVVVKPADGRQATVRLTPIEGKPHTYGGSLPQVLGDCQVRAYAFDARWPSWIAIKAQRRPLIKSVEAVATQPAYLGEPATTAPFTDLAVTIGGTVELRIATAEPVAKAEVELVTGTADPVLVPCAIDASRMSATVQLPVTATTSVRVLLTDEHGLTNPDPVSTSITALPDLPPFVAMTYPQRDMSATRFARWPLRFTAKDDHGLTKAAIRWQIEEATGEPQTIEIGDLGGERAAQRETVLEFNRFNAAPGTRIVMWIEVSDRKPQVGTSLKRSITILDPEQLRQELEAAREAAVQAIGTARDRQKEIKQGVERLNQKSQGTSP